MRRPKKKSGSRSRWPRRRLLVACLLAVPVVAAVSFLLALRWAGPRQALIERFVPQAEQTLDLRIEVGDFHLGVWSTSLEFRDVSVAHPGGSPFLLGERVRISLSPLALARRRIEVRAVAAEGLELDLEQLEPARFETAEEDPAGGSPFAADLDLGLAALRGGPVPVGLDSWLTGWRLEGGRLRGTVEGDLLDLAVEDVELILERPDGAARVGRLSGRLGRTGGGDFEVPELILAGRGVDIRIFGGLAGEAGGEQLWQGTFDLDPGAFFAVPGGSRGRIRGQGEFALPEITARVDLEMDNVPAEIARPWTAPDLFTRVAAAGTVLDLTGELDVRGGRLETSGDLVWRRGGTELLRAKVRTEPGTGSDGEVRLQVEADILPAAPGRREASGLLVAAGLLGAAPGDTSTELHLAAGEVLLDAPEVEDLWAEVARHWPALLPGTVPPQVTGELASRLTLAGPILDPSIDGEVAWHPTGATRILTTVIGQPARRRLEGVLDIEGFDPAFFGSPVPGTVAGGGSWRFGPSGFASVLELSADLATSRTGLSGEARMELGFADGTVEVELSQMAVAGARGRARARVPLASLGPLVSEGHPAGSPVEPLRLEWTFARESTWHEMIEALTGEPAGFELATGVRGELEFDPGSPTSSRGFVTFDATDLVASSLRLEGMGELTLALADEVLRLGPGRLQVGGETLEVDGRLTLDPDWRPDRPIAAAVETLDIGLQGRVPLESIVPASDAPAVQGALDLRLGISGSLPWPRVDVDITSADGSLALGEGEWTVLTEPYLALRVRPEGTSTLDARVALGDGSVALEASVPGHAPWQAAEASLRLERPVESVESLDLPLRVERGALVSRGAVLDTAGVVSEIELHLPLATLGEVLAERLWPLPLPVDAAHGPLAIGLRAERQEWTGLLASLGVEEPPAVAAGFAFSLAVDPAAPRQARGEVVVEDLEAVVEGRRIGSEGPLRLILGESRLALESSRLTVSGGGLELGGVVELAESWGPEDPLVDLVEHLEGRASGELPASLLNPFLGGGRAEGPLVLQVDVEGSAATLGGEIQLRGPEAVVAFIAPYAVTLGDFDLDLRFREGVAEIARAELSVNGGDVELAGTASLERGVDLAASLDGVRLRLDHGLITELSGELGLKVAAGSDRGLLEGTVAVDRGWLNRPIRVHSELLTQILSPFDLTGTEGSTLDQLDLDLELVQTEGVRVDNNLADLWVRWEPLEITGTALAPVIEGRLDVDPGGLVFLFGQTVRLDRAILAYGGQAGVAPTLDLETTTSLEDPSIGTLEGLDPLTASSTPRLTPEEKGEALAAGVAGYYGEQIAGRIAETLGASRFTVRPVLVFGEVDPSARLNIGRDFSSSITLAASIDLRNAERQTYLLDVHDVPGLPSFKGQVFTTDRGTEGATAQQRLEFGGTPATRVDGPRIRSIANDPVPGLSNRAVRRASGLAKGARLPDWGTFAAEIELESHLRSRGFPDARVEVSETSSTENRVDLSIGIVPGPRVEYVFAGIEMPRALRRTVRELYRADFFEEASLLEMERQAALALRSLGYLAPRVEIDVVVREAGRAEVFDRQVTIATESDRRARIEDLALAGLPEEEAERVAGRFPSRLQRVELAEGLEAADRRLIKSLAGFGWPDASIVARRLSEDGQLLTLELDPGSRLLLGAVRIEGIDDAPLPAELDVVAPPALRAGDPLSADLLAQGSLGLEGELRRLGYDAVRVTAQLSGGGEAGSPVDVTFGIDAGPRRSIGETRFAGLQSTRTRWAVARADLDSGGPLRQDDVLEARRRLYETGRFSSVVSNHEATPDDAVDVVFDVRERPRFRLAYGIRWESEEGGSVVLDLVDDSFLRRGLSLGGRALYSENDKSLRLNAAWPFLLFNKGTLEVFALGRQEFDEGLFFDTLESTIQFGYPLGKSNTLRAYTRYRDVHIYEEDPDPFFPIDVRVRNPFVGFQFIHDRRDEPQSTTKGLFASADLSVSDELLASDLSYARFFGQVNLFRPAGAALGRRLTWAQSYRVGFAAAFKGQELRLEDRLYAGGEYSVRGYLRESLGPPNKKSPFLRVDEDALFVVNQELRFDIWESVAGLVFFDAGNTWTGTTGYDLELFKSVGFGLRALTPVGLLRLDLAYPLDRRDIDSSYKIYIGFGNVF